jgi:hypothetical protein
MKPPIEMPIDFYAQVDFDIQRDDYSAPEASGRLGSVQAGFPLWQGVYTVDVVGQDESDAIRAFKDRMRGQARLFLGRDILRPYPKAHSGGFAGMVRAGGGAFSGAATAWSETITADSDSDVTLHGLPAGFTLGLCDYIGFHWVATETSVAGLTWHACVRVVEGGVADGTGTVTVTSEPPLPMAVPPGATAYLNQPACVMRLVTDQTKLQAVGRRLAIQGGQIVGIQDIRA